MSKTQEKGKLGEGLAREYLEKLDYKILEVNWRYKKAEIDLLCLKDDMLIVVEVKTRTNVSFGSPENFVNQSQQDHLFVAANMYMEEKEMEKELRFDIISVIIESPQQIKIKHLEDAFYPGAF